MGCKVDTLVERYALTVPDPGYASVDEYLVARWTGADDRSAEGYKSLTEWFNKRLLKRRYERHGRDTVSVHVDREYELITGENDLERDELAADLATDDLDIDGLADELVSWSTMRHHLKGCLDAEKDTATASTDWETNTVRKARERTAEKAQSVLSSLTTKDRLPDAQRANVDVQVKLSCPECSVRVPFEDAVERGYVCQTHLDSLESDEGESGRDRPRNQLSGVALPYTLVDALQSLAIGESMLVDAAVMAAV